MDELKKEMATARELLKDRKAARYRYTVSELINMLQENQSKAITLSDGLFQTIVDAYYLGFTRGVNYQKKKDLK